MERSQRKAQLKNQLEKIYTEFNQSRWIKTDPIRFCHSFKNQDDVEVIAFISALFAFGNVKSMCATLERIHEFLGASPAERLKSLDPKELRESLPNIYYRFFSTSDIHHLLIRMGAILREHQSLGSFVRKSWNEDQLTNLSKVRNAFVSEFKISHGLKFMFPDPSKSAAKRLHMFMRWMVRKDQIDLGIWNFISPRELIVPLDTHVFSAAQRMKLTRRKTPSLACALEVTERLKEIEPMDPLKYDFSICHLGMLKRKRAKASL